LRSPPTIGQPFQSRHENRNRSLGYLELFRATPLTGIELVVGKYLSHLILSTRVAAILVLVAFPLLNLQMTGDWPGYALMAAGVAFASVGPGLVISLLARSDGQAVQYSMILLLASVFFTGFFIKLDALW